jgi:hypothetical protein
LLSLTLLLLLLLRRRWRLRKALQRSLLLLLRGLLRPSCRRRLVDTHSISDSLRNILVLNLQVENDDDLLALYHIVYVKL